MTVLYVTPPNVPMSPAAYDSVMHASYAAAPQARLIRIDDARHYIHLDQPARFVAEVDAFMRR
jgi:pimeloyl-ACP methyl ester carboxylesterase